jgi:hypothetical protein
MGFGPMRHNAKFSTSRLIVGIPFFGHLMRVHSKGYAHALTSRRRCFYSHFQSRRSRQQRGTLYTFCPLTLRAKEWIDEHVQNERQWFGHALMVEHRYAWGLAQGMKDDGLVLA